MTAIGPPQRADEVTRVDQWIEAPRLIERDHLGLHAQVAGARTDQFQTVELALRRREHEAPVRMQSARLAGQRLNLAIQVDRVLLQPRDVGLAVERMHAAGRMPRRTGGQFAFFDQHHVAPADLGEVIQNARPHDATTDDNGSHRRFHDNASTMITAPL